MTIDLSDEKRFILAQFIEEEHDNLLTSIRIIIWKMGMAASIKEADDLAHEVMNETVITAIKIANRYELKKSSHAWLLSIATNKIREMRTKETRRGKRMGVVTETYQSTNRNSHSTDNRYEEQETVTEDEMIDFLMALNTDTNPLHQKIHLTFNELMSLVNPDDQHILKLAFMDNLRGADLAAALQTSVGAASVRLSRAIRRVKEAYLASEVNERRIK